MKNNKKTNSPEQENNSKYAEDVSQLSKEQRKKLEEAIINSATDEDKMKAFSTKTNSTKQNYNSKFAENAGKLSKTQRKKLEEAIINSFTKEEKISLFRKMIKNENEYSDKDIENLLK